MTGWQLLGLWLVGSGVIGVVIGKFLKYGSGCDIRITDADHMPEDTNAVSGKRATEHDTKGTEGG